MILAISTDTIQAVLGGAVSANQAQGFAAWVDRGRTPGAQSGRNAVVTNDTTDVTVVPAPDRSMQREVTYLSFYNNDSATVTLTVKHDDGTTESILWKATLDTLQFVVYTPGAGWKKYTAAGALV